MMKQTSMVILSELLHLFSHFNHTFVQIMRQIDFLNISEIHQKLHLLLIHHRISTLTCEFLHDHFHQRGISIQKMLEWKNICWSYLVWFLYVLLVILKVKVFSLQPNLSSIWNPCSCRDNFAWNIELSSCYGHFVLFKFGGKSTSPLVMILQFFNSLEKCNTMCIFKWFYNEGRWLDLMGLCRFMYGHMSTPMLPLFTVFRFHVNI